MHDRKQTWMIFLLLIALPGVAAAQNAKADSCANAANQAEMNECSGRQYQQDDAHLNRVYRKAMEYLQHDLAQAGSDQPLKQSAQKAIDDLKAAETAWIKYRDLHCQAAGQQYEGGTIRPSIENMCMSMATEHRIQEIKQAYENGDRKLE